MEYYAGIDVSLECSSVCVVDASGKIIREGKVASEPDALINWLKSRGYELIRVGLEAGPLSQWLFAAMREAGLAVELLEARMEPTGRREAPPDDRLRAIRDYRNRIQWSRIALRSIRATGLAFFTRSESKTWMAGTSQDEPGHDECNGKRR